MKIWIARDRYGHLSAYDTMPNRKGKTRWIRSGVGESFGLPSHYFPEVTFLNSPMELEINPVIPKVKVPRNFMKVGDQVRLTNGEIVTVRSLEYECISIIGGHEFIPKSDIVQIIEPDFVC
jgi:hypothetical protein